MCTSAGAICRWSTVADGSTITCTETEDLPNATSTSVSPRDWATTSPPAVTSATSGLREVYCTPLSGPETSAVPPSRKLADTASGALWKGNVRRTGDGEADRERSWSNAPLPVNCTADECTTRPKASTRAASTTTTPSGGIEVPACNGTEKESVPSGVRGRIERFALAKAPAAAAFRFPPTARSRLAAVPITATSDRLSEPEYDKETVSDPSWEAATKIPDSNAAASSAVEKRAVAGSPAVPFAESARAVTSTVPSSAKGEASGTDRWKGTRP